MNKDKADAVAQGTPRTDALMDRHSEMPGLATAYVAALELGRELEREVAALSAQVAADNIVIECCYAELKKSLGRDIECPAYIPDAIREIAAQVVELQKDAERYRKSARRYRTKAGS